LRAHDEHTEERRAAPGEPEAQAGQSPTQTLACLDDHADDGDREQGVGQQVEPSPAWVMGKRAREEEHRPFRSAAIAPASGSSARLRYVPRAPRIIPVSGGP